jgi:hypothetical protein
MGEKGGDNEVDAGGHGIARLNGQRRQRATDRPDQGNPTLEI